MAVPTAYLTSTKNATKIFEAIQKAGVPEAFTYEFLKNLGFASSSDRPIIPVLKAIGFLDDGNRPTDAYRRYKDRTIARTVMAQALRRGYSDLYAVDQEAHSKSSAQLAGVFGRLSDKGDAVTQKMAATFKSLASLADFDVVTEDESSSGAEDEDFSSAVPTLGRPDSERGLGSVLSLRHDIHVHLPLSTEVAVYDAIFKSLKANLL